MKKILAYLLMIIGVVIIGAGIYFQLDEKKPLAEKDIDWSLEHDFASYCDDFKSDTYELSAFNYTKTTIKVPNCLEAKSNSTFVRKFESSDKRVVVVFEVQNIANASAFFANDKTVSHDGVYASKKIVDNILKYKIIKHLEKDIYLVIDIASDNLALSNEFIESLIDAKYDKTIVKFNKVYSEGDKILAKLKMEDFEANTKLELLINLPKGYEENNITFADQKILLTKKEEVVSIEVVLNHSKENCMSFFENGKTEAEVTIEEMESSTKACIAIKDKFFYLVEASKNTYKDFLNYEIK